MRHLSEENLQEAQKGHTGCEEVMPEVHGKGKDYHQKEVIFHSKEQ